MKSQFKFNTQIQKLGRFFLLHGPWAVLGPPHTSLECDWIPRCQPATSFSETSNDSSICWRMKATVLISVSAGPDTAILQCLLGVAPTLRTHPSAHPHVSDTEWPGVGLRTLHIFPPTWDHLQMPNGTGHHGNPMEAVLLWHLGNSKNKAVWVQCLHHVFSRVH